MVITVDGDRLTARDLELTGALNAAPSQTLKEAKKSVKRAMVQDAPRRHKGKITSASVEFGVGRLTLDELLDNLGSARKA